MTLLCSPSYSRIQYRRIARLVYHLLRMSRYCSSNSLDNNLFFSLHQKSVLENRMSRRQSRLTTHYRLSITVNSYLFTGMGNRLGWGFDANIGGETFLKQFRGERCKTRQHSNRVLESSKDSDRCCYYGKHTNKTR